MKIGNKSRPGLWLSTSVSIIGLLLVVLLSYIIERTLSKSISATLLTGISLLIAFLPPLIWLTIFYRQDRLEPEPKSFVFKILVLGALVEKALYAPIMELIMPGVQNGQKNMMSDYIFTIILVALIQESIKLLSVRYSIYNSHEFDEKIDGIIYGSALGLGFAAMTNLDLIINNGGIVLSAISSTVVIESLAHASFTGLSCYFLGITKFSKFNFLRLPAAVIIAASLNAISRIIIDSIIRNSFKVNYFLGIIPAALVAMIVFGVLVIITSKSKGAEEKPSLLSHKESFLSSLPVWGLLVIALVTGFAFRSMPEKTTTVVLAEEINLTYPSSWTQFKQDENIFKAADMISGGQSFVSVKQLKLDALIQYEGTPALEDVGAAWSIKTGRSYQYYYPEESYILSINNQDAYVLEYMYVDNNTSSIISSKGPGVGYARDLVLIADQNVYVITISTDYNDWVLKKDNFNRINLSLNNR